MVSKMSLRSPCLILKVQKYPCCMFREYRLVLNDNQEDGGPLGILTGISHSGHNLWCCMAAALHSLSVETIVASLGCSDSPISTSFYTREPSRGVKVPLTSRSVGDISCLRH